MANLGPQHINTSYGDLLQLPNGLTGSLQAVQDGSGNTTPLEISNTAIDFPIESVSGSTGAITDLPSATGSQYVGFEQSGTGAVLRSAEDKMRDVVSVLDFGAISVLKPGYATFDSTTAFVDALATGRSVYIPEGTYLISASLQMQDGQIIYGDGSSQSIIKCKTSTFSGVCLNVGSHCKVSSLGFITDGTTAATAIKLWDSSNQYNFGGYINFEDVNITGYQYGLFVNNIFLFSYNTGIIQSCTQALRIYPSYSVSVDSGYVTTLFFQNLDLISNARGVYCSTTILSKNIVFRDCAIENNYTAGQPQAGFANCDPLTFDNCYLEGTSTQYALELTNCDTYISQMYLNSTGGIDLGTGSNTLRANRVYGTSATDILRANGTVLQNVDLNDCSFGVGSTLNATRMRFYNCFIGGVAYRNRVLNPSLNLTDNLSLNTAAIASVPAYKRTVTSTIAANTTVRLIYDQYLPNIYADDFVVGIANITNLDLPGIILSVGPASTGSSDYFNVFATNTTASSITITNGTLKVIFFKGTAMAI